MEPTWLAVALAEHGTREIRGGETPRIMQYHAAVDPSRKWLDEDEDPWCASFASWVLATAGAASPRTARARDFLGYGVPCDPIRGCLVVLRRGTSPDAGHVGFLLEAVGDQLVVLGGNQSDRVCVSVFSVADLLGFRWPAPRVVGGNTPREAA